MAKVGRNEPCPCGSGKKYKKCCLAKDEGEAGSGWRWPSSRDRSRPEPKRRDPEPPRHGPEKTPDRSTQETLKLLDDIFNTGWSTLLTTEYFLTHDVIRSLGYAPEEVLYHRRDVGELIVRYFMLGGTILTPQQAVAQTEVKVRLATKARKLCDTLLAAPFGLYRVVADAARDELEIYDALRDGPPVFVDSAIHTAKHAPRFAGDRAEGVVGWRFEHEQRRYLLVLGQLGKDGTKLLEDLSAEWPATDRHASAEVIGDILSALVDPRFEHRRIARSRKGSSRLRAGRSGEALVEEAVRDATHDLLRQLHGSNGEPITLTGRAGSIRQVRRFRERVAGAESSEERAALVDFVRRLRDELVTDTIKSVGRNGPVDAKLCERQVPLVRVLAVFGLRPDGTIERLAEEDLARGPSALLLVPDDHAVWAAVHRSAPIGAARRWVAEHPETEASAEVEAAWRRYLTEQRWLATFRSAEGTDVGVRLTPRYGELLHVFQALFDPAVREAPLDELDLGKGGLTRLTKAMTWMGRKIPADGRFRVRDLPDDEPRLLCAKGYGYATHDRLVDALALLASQWRPRRAGIDPATLDRAPRDGAVREILKEGLDELAVLFDQG
jgi:hypothetical protein